MAKTTMVDSTVVIGAAASAVDISAFSNQISLQETYEELDSTSFADTVRKRVGGLSDHKLYPFDVLGIDPTGDIALVKLERPEPFEFAALGDSDALEIGDYTLAMGNPFLLAEDYTPTVTLGIVSGTHRYQWGQGHHLVADVHKPDLSCFDQGLR